MEKAGECRHLLSALHISMSTRTDRAMVIGLGLRNTLQSTPANGLRTLFVSAVVH